MGHKLMGHTPPAKADNRDAVMDMGPDESLIILIKHCQDMKQQETRLRLITLLLLFSCTALFISTIWQHKNSRGQGSAVEQSPAFSKQESVCPAENPQTNLQRQHIHLRSVYTDNNRDEQYMKWEVVFGEQYNEEKCAILIPETGFYFVYVRIALSCQDDDGTENFRGFYVEVRNLSEGYNQTVVLTDALDGIVCTSNEDRSVFVGQLFDLLEGDHVSVWIGKGYELIRESSFGAYLT